MVDYLVHDWNAVTAVVVDDKMDLVDNPDMVEELIHLLKLDFADPLQIVGVVDN